MPTIFLDQDVFLIFYSVKIYQSITAVAATEFYHLNVTIHYPSQRVIPVILSKKNRFIKEHPAKA